MGRQEKGCAARINVLDAPALRAAVLTGSGSVQMLGAGMGLSASTLQQPCRRARRLALAREALLTGSKNIARITWRAGYARAANFATAVGGAFCRRRPDLRRADAAPRLQVPDLNAKQ